MATKNPHGNCIYDMLIDIIIGLSPFQAENLYSELLPRYSKRAKTRLYDESGEENPKEGRVRLLPLQYKALRTNYGDSYIRKSFTELTNYIKYLENNLDYGDNKQKLRRYNSKTHNILLTSGWVYNKCKQYIVKEPANINVNPYLIDDFATAKKYIQHIPVEMRESFDVQTLIQKFPELSDEPYIS